MKTIIKMILGLFAVGGAAGTAQAQIPSGPSSPPQGPPNAGQMGENPQVRNGGDTYNRDAQIARDDAIARDRRDKANSAKAAKPEDVVEGAEVRDSKGAVVGNIESVGVGTAVVDTPVGKVSVPLEAFGKNAKGLMIGMTKAEFEKVVVEANKPQ